MKVDEIYHEQFELLSCGPHRTLEAMTLVNEKYELILTVNITLAKNQNHHAAVKRNLSGDFDRAERNLKIQSSTSF